METATMKYARKLGLPRSNEDLEDYRAIGWAETWRASKTWDINRGFGFATYCCAAIFHRLCKLCRKIHRQKHIPANKQIHLTENNEWLIEDEGASDPFARAMAEEYLDMINEDMPQATEMVRAHIMEGMTYTQIGEHYGISKYAVRDLICISMDRLRAKLGMEVSA